MSDIQPREPYDATNTVITIYDNDQDYNKIISYAENLNSTTTGTSWVIENNTVIDWDSLYIYVYKGGYDVEELVTLIEERLSASSSANGPWLSIKGFKSGLSGTWKADLTWEIPSELRKGNQLYFKYVDIISDPLTLDLYSPIIVNISCSTPAASIYYTIDNNTPSASSTPYTREFEVESGTIIKAIGIKEGYISSDIVTFETKSKLPTPQGDIERVGRTYTLTILNFDEYPEGTIFSYKDGGTVEFTGSTYGMGENSLANGLYAKCEGYIDSDTVDVSWM